MRVRSPMRKYSDFQKADLLNNYVTPANSMSRYLSIRFDLVWAFSADGASVQILYHVHVLNFIRLFRTVRRFIINSVPADSFESNRPESKRVPFSSLPTALFCKHPPEVHAGDIRIGTHRRMKGEVTNSNKAHVAQSNTARVIIEVCLEVIYPPGGFKPLACCVRRK